MLNLAYNALCAGRALEDLELRRQDEAYLDLLGAERIPDPTSAGDFCRRFTRADLQALHEAYDVARRRSSFAWQSGCVGRRRGIGRAVEGFVQAAVVRPTPPEPT